MHPQTKSSSFHGKQFLINSKPTFLFSGEFHYYRTPHELWADRLLKCKHMLVNTVASYIPWNWHERYDNVYDFAGDRAVGEFIDEVQKRGLQFFARPGPYICSEWDSGSIPQWLQKSTRTFRMMDPSYLDYVERWYDQINQVLVSRQRSRGGNIVLYQIENEDWWCDLPYALALLKMVREDGVDVPVIVNENPKARGSELIDALDDYPLPWQPNSPYMFIPDGMEGKIQKLLCSQPDKPPMHTEFETGWYMEFGSCAPSKWLGDVPAEWIEVLMKSVISEGVNGLNMYMAVGGFNPGYWGSKNCTTGRDWIAPVHEWGELNQSFYNIRRIGGMLETLGADLVCSEVDPSQVVDRDEQVSIFARRSQNSVYLCPRSLSGQTADLRLTVPDVPQVGTLTFPMGEPYHLAGQSMAILPVHVSLHPQLPTILYSTAEVFRLFEYGPTVALVLTAQAGQSVEIGLLGEVPVEGDCQVKCADGRTILTTKIEDHPRIERIGDDGNAVLFFVNHETASRTWDFAQKGGRAPLLSNLYLVREDHPKENTVSLSAEAEPGQKTWLQVTADRAPAAARVNGRQVAVEFDHVNRTAEMRFEVEKAKSIELPLVGKWQMLREDLPGPEGTRKWQKFHPWNGVELHGLFENGYFIYRTQFKAPSNSGPLHLSLTRFWDEASVFLNGKFVEAGRNHLSCDMTPFIRWGQENELVVVVEVWGRWEHGFAEETGIIGPVLLTQSLQEIPLEEWKRKQVAAYPEPWRLTTPPPEACPTCSDADWATIRVAKHWDSRIHGRWRGKEYSWYRTKVKVPAGFSGKRISLDFGECRDECWVYINGKFVRWFNWFRVPDEPFSVDITDAIHPGQENTIAILALVKWHGQGGLHQSMRLSAADDLLNQDWWLSAGLSGENNGLAQPGKDGGRWQEINLDPGTILPDPHGIVWLKRGFSIDLPEGWVTPLGITMRGFEKKANIYLNGHFVGRYRSEGPQELFYVPEPWLKKENQMVIMLDGWKPGLQLGSVSLNSYPMKRKLEIELEF